MGNNPSHFESCGNDCPVESVSWLDVQDFINKLNTCGEGTYALPTEAQWEYAARAGSTTAFANGDVATDYYGYDSNLDEIGWYEKNSTGYNLRSTHPVAQKIPNDWGIYDMHGNVWEWCWDAYDDYPAQAATDPVNDPGFHTLNPIFFESNAKLVHRGGGYNNYARNCRSAIRLWVSPTSEYSDLGFRVVFYPDE